MSGCEESTVNPEALHKEGTALALLRANRLASSLKLQNNRMVQSTGFWDRYSGVTSDAATLPCQGPNCFVPLFSLP